MSDPTNRTKFRCVKCSRKMAVRRDWGGKRVKCPDCGEANVVPLASSEEAAPDLYEIDEQQSAADHHPTRPLSGAPRIRDPHRVHRLRRNVSASRRGGDPPPPGAVVVALLIAAGLVFAGIDIFRSMVFAPHSAARQSENWMDTPCTIVRHTRLERSGNSRTAYTGQAWYQYHFEGKVYEAHRLHFGHEGNGKSFSGQYGRSRAMKYVQQTLPLKLELRCYVNPANPEEAVIERKAVVSWFAIGGGAMFLLAGVGIASYITYKLIEERRRTKGNGGSMSELQETAISQLPSSAFAGGRRRLRGNPRGRSHTDWRWSGAVVGAIFTLIGVCIMLVAADVIPLDESTRDVPQSVVLFSIGLIFAIPGMGVGWRGWSNVRHHAKAKVSARDFPDEPWRIDRDWDRHESRAEGAKKVWSTFAGGAFLFLFLVPFNYFAFFDEWGVVAQILVSVFDGFMLWVWGYGVYLLMRQYKYGRSRIRFASFPFFPGKVFAADWTVDKGLGDYNHIVFTLRCVEEVKETTGRGENSTTKWVRYQTFAFTFEVEGPGRHEGGSAVPVAFPLPHTARGTDMTGEVPRYWELEVHADTPGVDFRAIYLVPIYRKLRG